MPWGPRPCAKVDMRHLQLYGNHGVRHHTAANGLAGWFFRLHGDGTGEMQAGDELVLTSRAHPEW